jgi:hypothetical protein
MKIAQMPAASNYLGSFLGLLERILIVAYFGWIFAFAFKLKNEYHPHS